MAENFQEWITLAHVCRRWRRIVFQSPRRLNLQLLCTPNTARDTLDTWPPLPLVIRDFDYIIYDELSSLDNIIAALERNDRVWRIRLTYLSSSQMGYVINSAAMQKSFPGLTDLCINMYRDYTGPLLLDSFLSGSAPRLRSLILFNVPFLALPKLLSSTTHLVYLDLVNIPRSGYIPPEAMATCLSALTNLEYLRLRFRYPRPRPALESRRLPPPTRSILPSLTKIRFEGVSEYLEEILARIDAPRINEMHITFFNQIIFDTPQLFQFISRRPTLSAQEKSFVNFDSTAIIVKFPSQTSDYNALSLEIPCTALEWQLSSLEQVCTSSLPPVSTLENLYLLEVHLFPGPRWQDDIETTLWLDFLRSFVAVKNLYLSDGCVPHIAPALQELVGGRTTEVLPILENIFLKDFHSLEFLHGGIEKFVAARRLTSRPITVSRWDMQRERERDGYSW